jgi:peptidoglycan/LPS O-acetylase OafA/YrhL
MAQASQETQNEAGLLPAVETSLGVQGRPALVSKHGRYYRPELDVLRCIAFLMVFTSHIPATGPAPSGFSLLTVVEESGGTGVCVFFALSAFLITELLLREQEETGTIHRSAFYVRRILRIWPLYFVAVAVSVAVPFVYQRWVAPLHFVLPYLLFSGNIATSALGAYPRNGMLAPLWSISVEEQFYLLWPLLLFWKGRSGAWFAILGILPLAWAVDLFISWHGGARDPNLWTNSLSQFQYFALGALISLYFHRRPVNLTRLGRVAMLAGASVFLFLAADPFHFLFDMAPERPVTILAGYLCNDAACILLLVGMLGARMPRFTNPLRYLGKISYGMYVFHYTLWIGMTGVVVRLLHRQLAGVLPEIYFTVLALTIGVSALSYHYFERSFLRLKERFAFVLSRPT